MYGVMPGHKLGAPRVDSNKIAAGLPQTQEDIYSHPLVPWMSTPLEPDPRCNRWSSPSPGARAPSRLSKIEAGEEDSETESEEEKSEVIIRYNIGNRDKDFDPYAKNSNNSSVKKESRREMLARVMDNRSPSPFELMTVPSFRVLHLGTPTSRTSSRFSNH
jgi:hypothetical protein